MGIVNLLCVTLLLFLFFLPTWSFLLPYKHQRVAIHSNFPSTSRHFPLHSTAPPFTEEQESSTTASSIEVISRVSALVSYQYAEEQLGQALAAVLPESEITHLVRGQLEDFVPDDNKSTLSSDNNIVDRFLLTLTSFTTEEKTNNLNDGLNLCHSLLHNAGSFTFRPPIRSLIGTVDGMDLSILRDKQEGRFSLLLSTDRARGRKLARLLAEKTEEGVVSIRGLHVHERHRGRGLSTLLIALFCQFCDVSFGSYPQTCFMNKPLLCVALSSLGFVPETTKWPAWVAASTTDPQVTLMASTEEGPDLGPRFSHAVRRAQTLELVDHNNHPGVTTWRKIHVLTKFLPPDSKLVERCLEQSDYMFYSARIVAFLSTLENSKGPMFRQSQAVGGSKSTTIY